MYQKNHSYKRTKANECHFLVLTNNVFIWCNKRMKLIHHLKPLSKEQRQALAAACETTVGHLKNVGYGYRPCAAELAVCIEQRTAGKVTRRDMRPDDWQRIWPELSATEPAPAQPLAPPQQPIQPAPAAREGVLQGVA